MKKSNKILLITGLATVTIGTAGILHTNYIQRTEEKAGMIKAYNYQPDNILDNVFVQDDVKYLPFIFESAMKSDNTTPKTVSKEEIIEAFSKKQLTIKNISTGDKIVTGTQITVNENSDVYNVVIYGDINADGRVNVLDIQKIVRHIIYKGEHELKGTYAIAANVHNSDSEVNVLDAQNIVKFCIDPVKNKLVTNEPTSSKEEDIIEPVITLIGQATTELEEGDSYTDEGATAIDNYDGDLTTEISRTIKFGTQTVETVDTSKVGTYTITYTVSDSNGNTASKTRTIIVHEKIANVESIELAINPFKTEYQYGEATTLDLRGAQINVKTSDGEIKPRPVTESMLSTYDLTTAGEKEITVTYAGKSALTKIKVKVLKPISGLVMNETGMTDNIQLIESEYKTNSKEDFTLGSIKERQEEGVSALQYSQLKVGEISVTATTDSTVTASDLTIGFEEADGNILVKGKATKVGNYTVKVYIEYATGKIERMINLTVKKSDVVGRVIVAPTEENEIIKIGKAAKRKLTVINVNEEEIEVISGNIVITPETGITIKRLDATGALIGEDEKETVVDSLQIETTTLNPATSQTIKMNMTVNGKAADFTFTVRGKSVLSELIITENMLDVYAVLPNNKDNVMPGASGETVGNIYTLLTPAFKDQYGDPIKVTENDIFASTTEDEVNNAVAGGQVGILLPKVKVQHALIPVEVPDSCIDVRCYMDGAIKTGSNEINQIGFSIILNDTSKTVNLTELAKAKVIIKVKGQEPKELPIKVHYKDLTTLGVDTTTITLPRDTGSSETRYITKIGEDFTLGTITVGVGETPVTADMLTTRVVGDATGINIKYTADSNGNIVVTGRVSKDGVYQVRPMLKSEYGNVVAPVGIEIESITTPEITSFELNDFEIQIGEKAAEKDLIVKSDINPTLQPIKAGEITFEQRDFTTDAVVNYLDITLRNADGQPINAAETPGVTVKSIDIAVKSNVSEAKKVKLIITLYADKGDSAYPKTVNITITQPIPKAVTVDNTVTLYDAPVDGITATDDDELVYTLLPIELFADTAKQRKIVASSDLFAEEVEEDKTNKVCIIKPKVTGYLTVVGPAAEQQIQLLEIKYFNENRAEASKDIKYIGVAMRTMANFTYNKTDLNGEQIQLICGQGTDEEETTTITISYSPQTN